jgi:hypothetical protein
VKYEVIAKAYRDLERAGGRLALIERPAGSAPSWHHDARGQRRCDGGHSATVADWAGMTG